jgi:hypothetical protein
MCEVGFHNGQGHGSPKSHPRSNGRIIANYKSTCAMRAYHGSRDDVKPSESFPKKRYLTSHRHGAVVLREIRPTSSLD